jgi:hypothetical protein
VVGNRQREIRAAHLAAAQAKRFEGLRAGHFVDEVAVDIDQAGAVIAALDHVGVPDLLVKGAGLGHRPPVRPGWARVASVPSLPAGILA